MFTRTCRSCSFFLFSKPNTHEMMKRERSGKRKYEFVVHTFAIATQIRNESKSKSQKVDVEDSFQLENLYISTSAFATKLHYELKVKKVLDSLNIPK